MNLYYFSSNPDKYVFFWYAYFECLFLVLLFGYMITFSIQNRLKQNGFLQLLFSFALAYVIRNVQANRKGWTLNGLLLILFCAEDVNLFFANSEPELLAENFFHCFSHTSGEIQTSRGSICEQYMWSVTWGRLNPALLSWGISESIWTGYRQLLQDTNRTLPKPYCRRTSAVLLLTVSFPCYQVFKCTTVPLSSPSYILTGLRLIQFWFNA